MTTFAERESNRDDGPRRQLSTGRATLLVAAVAAIIVLYGGYGQHWSWTGINGRTATLWDWLHLLLLPVSVGILPLWLSRRVRLGRCHKLFSLVLVAVLGVFVVAGYAVPWSWTGFSGNKLWDWLELVALPLAVALSPTVAELRPVWTRRHTAIAVCLLAVFVALVVGAYAGNWSWTGFEGNTLWNWLQLLLLPLLLPTIVVPALRPMATAGLITVEEGEAPTELPTGSAPPPPAPAESVAARPENPQ